MKSFALTLLFSIAATSACADDLVAGLSQDQIRITSNYTGTDITVFGAIESIAPNDASATRDVVVVIRGPDADMTVRRKARIAGVWVNRNAMVLHDMPTYYSVASSRPLAKIASAETLERYQIGIANVQPESASINNPAKAEPFRKAAVADRAHAGLYSEDTSVEFLGNSLFRARVPIPATVQRGEYTAEVLLFRDGNVVSAQSTPLYVDQFGFERGILNFAHHDAFWYGLTAVLIAALFGWLSSLMFRERG
jgi:uncharacterized protein (TIGR02186 family)